MKKNILLVDDEPVQLRLLEKFIGDLNYNTIKMTDGKQALDFFLDKQTVNGVRPHEVSVMLLDLQMPKLDGLSVLKRISNIKNNLQIIVLSATRDSATIIDALNSGADDYIIKGEKDLLARVFSSINNSIEKQNLKQQVAHLEAKSSNKTSFSDLIGNSKNFILAIEAAKKAAKFNSPILIEGQFGVGKELLARAIHGSSPRAGKPFIVIDCNHLRYSDFDDDRINRFLFGSENPVRYESQEKSIGKIREAEGGTIFFDNISCLTAETQIKLLRFMQEGIIEPVGSKSPIKASVRIISSTVKDLDSYVKCERFRGDLYYCLSIFLIKMPSLLERGNDDIKLLAERFCHDYSINENKKIKGFTERALELFYQFDWEGNIRQLKSYVFRAVVLCDGWVLKPEHFSQIPDILTEYPNKKKPLDNSKLSEKISLIHTNGECKTLEEIETEVIEKYLDLFNGNLSEVSKQLQVGRSTIYRKLK